MGAGGGIAFHYAEKRDLVSNDRGGKLSQPLEPLCKKATKLFFGVDKNKKKRVLYFNPHAPKIVQAVFRDGGE